MILPWHRALWNALWARPEQMAHALLLCGPSGVGKRVFAEALAARLLCETPNHEGMACGHCPSCHWRIAGNHPDFHCLEPEEEGDSALADAQSAQEAGSTETKKKGSAQIVIAQLRALQARLVLTAHRGQGRVTIIEPAERMNEVTANALLKRLEEPPEGCFFLLISHQPGQLLPTLRSRCQTWGFSPPPKDEAQAWLSATQPKAPLALLPLCGGRPLEAARLAAQGAQADYMRFVRDMQRLSTAQTPACVTLAGEWEQWLKSSAATASGMDRVRLLAWLQAWVFDLVLVASQTAPRFFTEQAACLASVVTKASRAQLLRGYHYLTQQRALAHHPLNVRLFLEDVLIHYCAHLAPPSQ